MGCDGMKKFTCTGTSASMVHMIETANRKYGTEVMVDTYIQREVASTMFTRMLVKVNFKGKEHFYYEICGLKQVGEDEWMYQLEEGEKADPNKTFNQAMK